MKAASAPAGGNGPPPAPAASGDGATAVIRGLYAITPDQADTSSLVDAVEQTLAAGTRLLQYRNKTASALVRREQLRALQALCASYQCTLVVNDDWRSALDLGIGAVHIGSDDGDAASVRAAVGPAMMLGISCYASLDRARAVLPYADYLAFGSVFSSATKPTAASAPLQLLRQAREFGKPLVAIGGINVANAGQALAAGADAVAVISGIFGAGSIPEATAALMRVVAEAKVGRTEAEAKRAAEEAQRQPGTGSTPKED